jgi:hypothetical protein
VIIGTVIEQLVVRDELKAIGIPPPPGSTPGKPRNTRQSPGELSVHDAVHLLKSLLCGHTSWTFVGWFVPMPLLFGKVQVCTPPEVEQDWPHRCGASKSKMASRRVRFTYWRLQV